VKWWWILALGIALTVAVIAYAWYRGGEESAALALAACR
jgi:hypothetical protein